MKLHRLAWVTGLVGLPLSHYWLVAQVEPFYSLSYCFLWWSYIFSVDFAVYCLRGNSLLRDQPREFSFLAIWSVPVWLLFEMVNLRLHNWYYVMAPCGLSWGYCFILLAFATVLPGIFETTSLVLAVMEKFLPNGKITGRPFAVSRSNVTVQLALGALMLALMLIFPSECFCLAWGFAFFLTDPICYWIRRKEKNQTGRSLLGQLAAGDNTRLVALLVTGFICGGLWEAWNLGSRTKWIYSVPFFDELKLGEMPVLGFGGFPPFALECYVMVNFLSLFRDGRNWELTPEENHCRRGMPAWVVTACVVLLPLVSWTAGRAIAMGGNVASWAVCRWIGFFHKTSAKRASRPCGNKMRCKETNFLKLKERPPEIDAELYARLRRIAAMSELKGMGVRNALALEKLGIKDAKALASRNPEELAPELEKSHRIVRLEEVKVWIREARRMAQG